jgi:hypothetical protein
MRGMADTPSPINPVPLTEAALILCVSPRWLRAEILGGRLPGLRAGNEFLVHIHAVRYYLAERARLEWEARNGK